MDQANLHNKRHPRKKQHPGAQMSHAFSSILQDEGKSHARDEVNLHEMIVRRLHTAPDT